MAGTKMNMRADSIFKGMAFLAVGWFLATSGILPAQTPSTTPSVVPTSSPAPPPASESSSESSARTSSDSSSGIDRASIAVDSNYVLQNNDEVRITVFGEEDMTTETRVSKTGYIAFPLLGSIRLGGMTIDEATAMIRKALDKDYIVNPQVRITLMEYAKQRVTILGQVKEPGSVEIPVEGGLDILGAVAMAGGFTRIADPGRVTVRRNVGGKDTILRVNCKELEKDSSVAPFLVKPGDTITVPESIF
jgi:polysaccharide export outer membrane protein